MRPELEIKSGDQVRKIPLEGERITLGRAHSNDLCYPDDASLSRTHACLERVADGWSVSDMGSKNGTMLNGRRIAGVEPFQPGDRLSLGQLAVTYLDGSVADTGNVVFVAGSEPTGPAATVMTSLEGLLSGETTSPLAHPAGVPTPDDQNAFQLPVVRALIHAGRELAGDRPLDELFPLILELSIETVGAERGVVMTLEKGELTTRAVRGDGFRISTSVRDRVVKEKTSMLVHDTSQEELLRNQMSVVGQQIRSLMAAPLQTENDVIGLIYVDSQLMGRQFTPDDLSLLTVLANVAAIRIDHASHLQLQQQEQRRTADLESAAEIQRAILPSDAPHVERVDLAGHNAPCRTVGGDYYDFFAYPDGRVGLVVADVAGKGMAAALLMANLQARVQMLAVDLDDLALLMGKLDQAVAAHSPANRFITMFLGVIDPEAGTLTYCNAGHNPPLLIGESGPRALGEAGTVLGMLPELGYEQYETPFASGDMLVVYSDGVTEAADAEGEEFELERLTRLLESRRQDPCADIVSAVNQALTDFTGAAPAEDDVTIVVARRRS